MDGVLERKKIGPFDDACKIMVAELGTQGKPPTTQLPNQPTQQPQPSLNESAPPPLSPLPSSEDQGLVEARIKELDERANYLEEVARKQPVPKLEEKLALIEQNRRQLEEEREQLKSAPATHEKEPPTPPPTPLAESTTQKEEAPAKEEKTHARQRKSPAKLDFNKIRGRVSEWNKKGYYFSEIKVGEKDWIYACNWDKDTQKMDKQSIGPYDDRMKKLLERMKISLKH